MSPGSQRVPICRHGVLAFGDSITNGGGELQWGVALQSWALWVARGLGLPFTSHAVDGATVQEVVGVQISRERRLCALEDPRYHLGCLYIGVNDVRSDDWEPSRFDRDLREAMGFIAARVDTVLSLTAPLDLGRPRTPGARVRELNAIIGGAAGDHGALLLDLSNFGARNQIMSDRVHPTAFGQIAIAERALVLLAAHGMPTLMRPSERISYETTRWKRLRGDATLLYRGGKVAARAAWQGRSR